MGTQCRRTCRRKKVKPVHFDHWLGLFDYTLYANLPSQLAIQWSLLAHWIGRGLSMGVEDVHRPQGQAPKLRQVDRI